MISNDSSGHGNQKICHIVPDKLLIDIKKTLPEPEDTCCVDLKVGRYSNCRVNPTCGLTIFGRTFGNYAQDIQVSLSYAGDTNSGWGN